MRLPVIALGASTAVGLSAEQTAFGLRAQLFSPRSIGYVDEDGEELGAVLLTSIPEEIQGWERFVWLALPALREARAVGGQATLSDPPSSPKRLFLALPTPRPGFDDADRASVVEEIAGAALEGCAITTVTGENEAFGRALALAVAYLQENPTETALVGGVDSRHDRHAYASLDGEFRLLSQRAPDGFIPGEGAAFAWIAGREARAAEPLAVLVFAEARDERASGEADAEFTDLLESAARTLDRRDDEPLPWVLVDQVGERHRARSWARVTARLPHLIDARTTTVDALAERLGDVGAASGAILLVYATVGLASGFGPGASAVVALGGDSQGRATFALSRARNAVSARER